MSESRLLTPDELAKKLTVEKSTIYSWKHQGKIPFKKIGQLLRFDEAEIEAWIVDQQD